MKPKAEDIIELTARMRRFQKEFFKNRDGLALRKSKELEKELDKMLAAWYGGGTKDEETKNQLNLF